MLLLLKLLASVALGPFVELRPLSLLNGALALAALSHAPAQAVPDRLQGLITPDDYPLESLDANEQGEVRVRIRVDTAGAVTCTVRKSSGYPRLDKHTCDLIEQRLKPAGVTVKRGRSNAFDSSIVWRMETGPTSPVNSSSRTIFSQAYGKPATCRAEGVVEGHDPPTFNMDCPASQPRQELPEFPGVRVDYVIAHAFRVGQEPTSGMAPKDKLLGRQVAKIDVDATGKADCKVLETEGDAGQAIDVCSTAAPAYAPLTNTSGQAIPFAAYVLMESYVHVEKIH